MATAKTEITEIVTGLGLLGYRTIEQALATRPAAVSNVTSGHFDRLDALFRDGGHGELFDMAWNNGLSFARSAAGLRGRPPWSIEWKGPHRPPAYEQIPADLRVDHVYLISCKYGSKILLNSSPSNLFDQRLAIREAGMIDWFDEVAPLAYREFYQAVRRSMFGRDLPADLRALTRAQRDMLRKRLPRRLSGEMAETYQAMNVAVATESARRWARNLATKRMREEMAWRLLRFQAAPYFILGQTQSDTPIRIRVATPWDARNQYEFLELAIEPGARAQAVVGWHASFRNRASDSYEFATGHVQVRWSHGKFGQVPEAKVYLDTPYHEVPGYFGLDDP